MDHRGLLAVGRFAVALDIAVRCAVVVVSWLLIREFWGERIGPDGDGFPVVMLIVPLGVYIAWNVWRIVRSIEAWVHRSVDVTPLLAEIALLSLIRPAWLVPLADGWWWHRRESLMLLVGASVACTTLALAVAVRLTMVGHDPTGPLSPQS